MKENWKTFLTQPRGDKKQEGQEVGTRVIVA